MENSKLSVKIPYDLARFAVWQRCIVNKYETNRFIKALDTWLILKSLTRSSLIQHWRKQKIDLVTACKCSESIFYTRLNQLKDLGLVRYDRNNITVCSWEDLGTVLEINTTEKITILYDISNSQRVQDWIIAASIKENQNRQAYLIRKKLNKNPALMMAATEAVLKAGAKKELLKDFSYFLSWLMILYRADFVQASEIHDLLIEIRPDTNRGVKTMAKHWCAKSPSIVSYWKAVLQRTRIADITKLQVQSQERVRNKQCCVLWLSRPKQTLLCLCDNIQILAPCEPLKTIFKDNTFNEDFSNRNLSAA